MKKTKQKENVWRMTKPLFSIWGDVNEGEKTLDVL